jgi:hypothetical protein
MKNYDGSLSGRNLENSNNSILEGRPEWQGIEYDWEVPDNQVIASPGGVSSVHHHHTKGFYGRGNMSSDIFAGQGERYNSGVYGNLYQKGHESSQTYYGNPPPDKQYWNNMEPSSYSYSQIQEPSLNNYEMGENAGDYETPLTGDYETPLTGDYETPLTGDYEKKTLLNQYSEGVENYTYNNMYNNSGGNSYIASSMNNPSMVDDDFELISSVPSIPSIEKSDPSVSPAAVIELCTGTKVKPWEYLLFLVLVFIVVAFWADTSLLFVKQNFHGGGDPSWQKGLLYSIIITFVFILLIWLAGYPIDSL